MISPSKYRPVVPVVESYCEEGRSSCPCLRRHRGLEPPREAGAVHESRWHFPRVESASTRGQPFFIMIAQASLLRTTLNCRGLSEVLSIFVQEVIGLREFLNWTVSEVAPVALQTNIFF
jgi:hypothetical protein